MGHLDEVLDHLGVFRCLADDVVAPCPSGMRRVPISQGPGFYISLQGFGPNQTAYAHTHPDSEEWIVVLTGSGRALFDEAEMPLVPGMVVGRAAALPHGFVSDDGPMHLLSIQLPRPAAGSTRWDESGETTDPVDCAHGGVCRRCARCGGHSKRLPRQVFVCENCGNEF